MSLFCPKAECKAQPGMCKCEKIMSAIVVLVAAIFLIRISSNYVSDPLHGCFRRLSAQYGAGRVLVFTRGFGDQWVVLAGLSREAMDPSMAKRGYLLTFLCVLIRTYVLAQLVILTNTIGLIPGARLGLWLGLGFLAVTMAPRYYFPASPASSS